MNHTALAIVVLGTGLFTALVTLSISEAFRVKREKAAYRRDQMARAARIETYFGLETGALLEAMIFTAEDAQHAYEDFRDKASDEMVGFLADMVDAYRHRPIGT